VLPGAPLQLKNKILSTLAFPGGFLKRFALAAALLCFAFGAEAATWSTVVANEKMRIEVDLASLIRRGAVVTAWDREIYSADEQAQPGDFYFKSSKSLVRYGCDARIAELLMRVYYAEDGSEIKIITADYYGRPNYVIPDTAGEQKFEYVCNYKKPEKKKPAVVAVKKKKAKPKEPSKAVAAKAVDARTKIVVPGAPLRGIPRYLPIRRQN